LSEANAGIIQKSGHAVRWYRRLINKKIDDG
jgi:hypothetical protein